MDPEQILLLKLLLSGKASISRIVYKEFLCLLGEGEEAGQDKVSK